MATPETEPSINDKIHRILDLHNTPSEASAALHALLELGLTSYSSVRQALKSRMHATASLHHHTTIGLFHAAATTRRSYPRSTRTRKLAGALGEETWKDLVDKGRLAETIELKELVRRHKDVLYELAAELGREEYARFPVVGALVKSMLVKEAEEEEACEELFEVEQKNREVVIGWLKY